MKIKIFSILLFFLLLYLYINKMEISSGKHIDKQVLISPKNTQQSIVQIKSQQRLKLENKKLNFSKFITEPRQNKYFSFKQMNYSLVQIISPSRPCYRLLLNTLKNPPSLKKEIDVLSIIAPKEYSEGYFNNLKTNFNDSKIQNEVTIYNHPCKGNYDEMNVVYTENGNLLVFRMNSQTFSPLTNKLLLSDFEYYLSTHLNDEEDVNLPQSIYSAVEDSLATEINIKCTNTYCIGNYSEVFNFPKPHDGNQLNAINQINHDRRERLRNNVHNVCDNCYVRTVCASNGGIMQLKKTIKLKSCTIEIIRENAIQ